MAFSFETSFLPLVQGTLLGNRAWLARLNTGGTMAREASTSGAVSLKYISAVTASAIVDGTMVTNGTTTANVNGTYVDEQVTSAFLPSESWMLTKPDEIAKIAIAHADALIKSAQNAAIADLKAGTALTGGSQTLATGSVDFAAGTLATARAALAIMAKVVSLALASFTNFNLDDFSIVMPPNAFGNFIALKAVDMPVPQYFASDGLWRFMGIPCFVITGATSFGGASLECAFVTCKDSVIMAREEPRLWTGGVYQANDATNKITTVMPYAHGVVNSFFLEVVNPAS